MNTPEDFGFPFTPYSIQTNFMKTLYQVLEGGKLGIFESPTGTGKSLSLICGVLTWLRDHEQKRLKDLEEQVKNVCLESVAEDEDWFQAAIKNMEKEGKRCQAKFELDALKAKELKISELRHRRQRVGAFQVQKVDSEFDDLFRDLDEVREAVQKELARSYSSSKEDTIGEDEEELVVEDYESDGDEDGGATKSKYRKDDLDLEPEEDYSLRIYYCSRTHSQLSQFVREVQKTKFASDIRLVSLASRGNLCINESVLNLKHNHLINDSCLDLQKKSQKGKSTKLDPESGKATKRSKTTSGCPYRKAQGVESVRDQSLIQVQDIEQLVNTGRSVKGCPYYGSRQAVIDAQVVVIPYNSLLHKPTRESLGIKLKNSVVIVDEAHNLLDTISHIHSSEIRGDQLLMTHDQLSQYLDRYRSRLKAKNLLYIKQMLFILNNFLKQVGLSAKRKPTPTTDAESKKAQNTGPATPANSRLVTVVEFLSETEIFNLNIVKLVQYIDKSKIAIKMRGFSQRKFTPKDQQKKAEKPKGVGAFLATLNQKDQKTESPNTVSNDDKENANSQKSSTSSPLFLFDEFLQSLINVTSEGRILVTSNPSQPTKSGLKFLLLNPAASHFGDLVSQCRSVIVAGGTMQPIEEFRQQLFVEAGAQPDRIVHFACGHVIPDENILPLVMSKGPTGRLLDFSYQFRNQKDTLDELGRVLTNICTMVPGGLICFFPSYDYESLVYDHLDKGGFISKLGAKKTLFREPKNTNEMDKVLKDYGRCAKTPATGMNGAILFSVVGGKMSEGINFSDDLGRCVAMIGLPFPNSKAPEIKERMSYLDKHCPPMNGRSAGQVYYENLCMKAVNQSIGRAIRHQNDYASILLIDHRYSRPNISGQLPQWIAKFVVVEEKFGPVMPKLRNFFKSKTEV